MPTSPDPHKSSAAGRLQSIVNHVQNAPSSAGVISQTSNATVPYKFQGWMGLDKDSVNGEMVWQEYEPKTWQETDVDIQITHCGVCASDLHTLHSGWVSC